MAKNIEYIRSYGDEDGAVYVAPRGTEAPEGLGEVQLTPQGWADLGWLSDEGIEESLDKSEDVYRAWQGAKVVRKKITEVTRTFKVQCLEENAATVGLKYRGQKPVKSGSDYATITVKDQTRGDTRAFLIHMVDGAVKKRYVLPAADYSQTGTIKAANTSLSILEYEITPVGDWFEISNNPALLA